MKVTITFDLELENEISETQKMEIIHKVDHFIETLEPIEMVKRTEVVYPFHVHGWCFNPNVEKENLPLGINPLIIAPLKAKKL